MKSRKSEKIDTTLGDLIAAASEVAFEYSDNDREGYQLARLAIIELLKKASHPGDLDNLDEDFGALTRKTYLH